MSPCKKRLGRFARLGVAVACMALAACESAPRASSSAGGIDLTMYVLEDGGSEEYFTVDRDGALGYGGGMNARLEKTVWTDHLTADEAAQLKRLIAERGWCGKDWESTDEPKKQRYRVSLNSPDCRQSFRLKGEHPDVKPVRDLLHDAALRRLKSDLDRLPSPSLKQSGPTTAPAEASGR